MPENAKSAYSFLGTMKSKATQILSGPVNTYTKKHPKKNSKDLEGVKNIIMNFRDGKITTIGKANTAVSKLLKFINGTLFELVAANAIVMSNAHGKKHTYYTVVEALDKAGVRWTGPQFNDGIYGTTDIIFSVGKLKIGYDVKSSRELYMKTYSGQGALFDFVKQSLLGELPYKLFDGSIAGGTDILDLFAYGIVNASAMVAMDSKGVYVDSGSELNMAFINNNLMIPLQRIGILSATVKFIDEYLGTFSNNLRDQIVILMGDNVIFLTDFLIHIKKLIAQFYVSGNYNNIGYIITGEKFETLANKIPKNLLTEIARYKYDLTTSDSIEKLGKKSFYPHFLIALRDKFTTITESVLGSSISIQLNFKFNKI